MKSMPKQTMRYNSISEVRSSLYPGSAGVLNLEHGDVLDLRGGISRRRGKVTNGDLEDFPEDLDELTDLDEDLTEEDDSPE